MRLELSLSVRIGEEAGKKDRTTISFGKLAVLASDIGYGGLCIRPSQVTVKTPDEEVQRMRETLDYHGLRASMVTLDPVIAANSPDAGRPLRSFDRHVDLAEMFGADLIRIAIKNDGDVAWAQRACDQAKERGIRLQHQTHTSSPFETIDQCLEMVKRIDRPNFGIAVEPGNLALCGQDYGPDVVERLGPLVFNVYLQNVRLSQTGSSAIETNSGQVRYERLIVGEEGGIDFEYFFAGLRSIGYDGFVTTHQPAMEGRSARELAQYMFDRLARFL